MVKSAAMSTSRAGLRDWFIQRITAVYMTIYTLVLLAYLLGNHTTAYYEWHHAMSFLWTRVGTAIFIICLLWHAWIGLWTVLTDYVKPFLIRLILNVVILFCLLGFFFESLLILWSV